MHRLLAALAAGLPALVLAAPPAQSPSFACSAGALDTYAPGNWYCGGSLTIADGTLDGGESLIILAKDDLVLKNVRLQAAHVLLSAATVSIDGSAEIDASGALTAADGLVPALEQAGYAAARLSGSLVIGTPDVPQSELTRIWYDSHAIVNSGQAGGVLTWTVPDISLSLVPEPAGWQFAALGAGVLAALRLRGARRA